MNFFHNRILLYCEQKLVGVRLDGRVGGNTSITACGGCRLDFKDLSELTGQAHQHTRDLQASMVPEWPSSWGGHHERQLARGPDSAITGASATV